MRRALPACVLATLCLAGTSVGADPMRPLAVPGKAPAPGATASDNPTPRAADAPKALGRLVAIRQDSRGQRQALIGERWVAVGDRIDDRTVAAIGANQVELVDRKVNDRSTTVGQTGKTHSTLHLLPPLQASTEPSAAATTMAEAARGTGQRRAGSTP